MEIYRVFCIDGKHFAASEQFECQNDDEAKASALGLLRCCSHETAELWKLARFVGRFHRKDVTSESTAA